MFKKGEKVKIHQLIDHLIGIEEKSNKELRLPVMIISNRNDLFEVLEDQNDHKVLIYKRKVVQLENGSKVLADIYVDTKFIQPVL